MRKLLWKEWHEQAWKLGFGCIVLLAFVVIGLRARIIADTALTDSICLVSLVLLPVMVSTGLVPAERDEGSLESLLAMPIKPWKVLAAKTILGALLVVVPLMLGMVVSLWMAGGREVRAMELVAVYGRTAIAAVAMLVWMMALTIRLPSEARAALVAMGIVIITVLGSAALTAESLRASAFAVSPLAAVWPFNDNLGPGPSLWLVGLAQVVILPGVWWVSLRGMKA